jgi:hypothetical protein
MPKSPQERAVEFANTNSYALYKRAKKRELPRAASLGWAVVHRIAEEVFANGGLAPLVREEVLKWAATPQDTYPPIVEQKEKLIRKVPNYLSGGKVPRRAGGD